MSQHLGTDVELIFINRVMDTKVKDLEKIHKMRKLKEITFLVQIVSYLSFEQIWISEKPLSWKSGIPSSSQQKKKNVFSLKPNI